MTVAKNLNQMPCHTVLILCRSDATKSWSQSLLNTYFGQKFEFWHCDQTKDFSVPTFAVFFLGIRAICGIYVQVWSPSSTVLTWDWPGGSRQFAPQLPSCPWSWLSSWEGFTWLEVRACPYPSHSGLVKNSRNRCLPLWHGVTKCCYI